MGAFLSIVFIILVLGFLMFFERWICVAIAILFRDKEQLRQEGNLCDKNYEPWKYNLRNRKLDNGSEDYRNWYWKDE